MITTRATSIILADEPRLPVPPLPDEEGAWRSGEWLGAVVFVYYSKLKQRVSSFDSGNRFDSCQQWLVSVSSGRHLFGPTLLGKYFAALVALPAKRAESQALFADGENWPRE